MKSLQGTGRTGVTTRTEAGGDIHFFFGRGITQPPSLEEREEDGEQQKEQVRELLKIASYP